MFPRSLRPRRRPAGGGRHARTRVALWLASVVAIATGCERDLESRAAGELRSAVEPRDTPSPDTPPPPRDDVEAMLAFKAKSYAKNLIPDGEATVGTLGEGERRDLLAVLKGGFCYRVLGAGGPEVSDMDLFLYDPNGVQTHQDPAEDPFPVLGLQADICPATAGSYRIQVQMYKGSGRFAVQLFRTAQ